MLHKLFTERWFVLPTLSGVLVVLSFHPFDFLPLAFFAFAPLFYAVYASPDITRTRVFFSGFISEGIFALSLSYFTVIQFHWLPETYLFTTLVHLLFIPLALLGGVIGGTKMLLLRRLRCNYLLFDVLLMAAIYTAGEMLLYALCGGYYFAMLAYAVTPLVSLMAFAALGGAFFVSFLIALINAVVAAALTAGRGRLKEFAIMLASIVVLFILLYACVLWDRGANPIYGKVSVAIVQVPSRDMVGFGQIRDGSFTFPTLAQRLSKAGATSPDLVIYPFSPVEGAVYEGVKDNFNKKILVSSGDTLRSFVDEWVAPSTTVMFWATGYASSSFSNEFQFVKDKKLVAIYRKRKLFPFIDYTPAWSARAGFYSTQVDMTPGETDQLILLNGYRVEALLCSEVHQRSLVRVQSAQSSFILSAGSEAVFVDDVASAYSLKAAQYRAAENNIPVIRANIIGPSGIIDRDGSFIAVAPRGFNGTLEGTVGIREPHPTVFSLYGDTLLESFLMIYFSIAVIMSLKRRDRHG